MNDISQTQTATPIPSPRFQIGDRVYLPDIRRVLHSDCPDCGNTNKWTVTTGSGLTFDIPCPRCQGNVLGGRTSFIGGARQIEIAQVHIRYASKDGPPNIVYIAGRPASGHFGETSVFETITEALEVAERAAAEQQAAWIERDSAKRLAVQIGKLPIQEALAPVLHAEIEDLKKWRQHTVDTIIEMTEEDYRIGASTDELRKAAAYILTEIGEDIPEDWGLIEP